MTSTRPPDPAPPRAAGFWQRELAWLIDATLLGVASQVLLLVWMALPLPWPVALEAAALRALLEQALVLVTDPLAPPAALAAMLHALLRVLGWTTALATLAYALLALPYFVLMESGPMRASIGKQVLGLVAGDPGGRPLGRGRAIARHLASALSWATLNLGHALAAWTPTRRALHDRLTGTGVFAEAALPRWAWWLVGLQVAALLAPLVLALALLLVALLLAP